MPHDQKQKAKTIANAYLSGCNGLTYRLQYCSASTARHENAYQSGAWRNLPAATPIININPTRHSLTATFLFCGKAADLFCGKAASLLFSHGGKAARPAPSVDNLSYSFAGFLLNRSHCDRLSTRGSSYSFRTWPNKQV